MRVAVNRWLSSRVVALVVTMLMAAILTFGQMLYCDQTLQQAADIAARELSRTPLPASCTLHAVLYGWSDGSDAQPCDNGIGGADAQPLQERSAQRLRRAVIPSC